MKKNLSKRILAFLLVVMMAVPVSMCALAEDPQTQTVEIWADGDDNINKTVGNIEVTGEGQNPGGVNIHTSDEAIVEVTVTGYISVEADGITAVAAYAEDDATTIVNVEGPLEATSTDTDVDPDPYSASRGVEVNASDNGTVEVTTGDVTTEGFSYNAVQVITSGADAEATVTVGDIDASNDGVSIQNYGGEDTVTTEDISAEGTGLEVRFYAEYISEDPISLDEFHALESSELTCGSTDRSNQDTNGSYSFTEHWLDGNTQYDVFGYYDASTQETQYGSMVNKTVAVYNPSDVTVTVNGNIDVKNEDSNTTGVKVNSESNLSEAKLEVTINGDINSESGIMATGISIDNHGGDYDIDVDGSVTATGKNATGIYSYADDEAKTDLFIAEELNAKSDAYAYGMNVNTYSGAEFSAEIGESMSVEGGISSSGIRVGSSGEADADVSVDGDLTVSGKDYAFGIQAESNRDGSITIDIDGSIDVSSGKQGGGILAESWSGGSVNITVGEGIEVASGMSATGIQAYSSGEESKTQIEVKDGGVSVEGDRATAVSAIALNGSETIIDITGDVASSGDGLYISVDKNSEMDVLIDGTLSGEKASVILSGTADNNNMNLTVWEVKANEDGNLAERYDITGEDPSERVADRDFEKKIQYIIKMEPNENATLSTQGTTKYEGYDVAHEGDTVVLKVNVADGYHIVNAYNGTDTKVELLQDENGNYYLVVPRGGAVLLSVTLEADAPAAVPDTAPAAAPATVVVEEVTPAAPVYTYVAPKATMPEVKDSPETAALKDQVEAAIKAAATAADGDIFSFLPATIKALIPESFKKIRQIVTLELINYQDNMGEVSFTVKTNKQYTAGEEAFVLFMIPGEEENVLTAKAVGQADGTLKITPDAATLKLLANKKFVAVILDQEEAAE